jgi:hypothetical protein
MKNINKANMNLDKTEPPDEDSPILLNKTRPLFLKYEHSCDYHDSICNNLKWIEEKDYKIFIFFIVFFYLTLLYIFCKREHTTRYKRRRKR